MTREEAVYMLVTNYPNGCYRLLREAVDMAIAALEREQQLLDAGYQNATVDFYIDGRLFRAKEIAQ